MLQAELDAIQTSPQKRRFVTRELLCSTIAGTRCDLLTVAAPSPPTVAPRFGVILTARVHPGETVGSWMMKGAIDFLLSEEREAEILRDQCVFKLVPMLNPDGVIQGNYRCSLAGCDLNRRYAFPSKVFAGLDVA